MSTSHCAADPGLAEPQPDLVASPSEVASRHLKGLLIGFGATVTIGLALASWYVGVRIVDANETVPVSAAAAPVSQTPAAPASQTPAAPSAQTAVGPSPQEQAMAEAYWHKVPPPPDLYLQVAGLGSYKDSSFVKGLEAKGYRAHVVMSANESTANQQGSRILIGPFVGRSSLEAAARKLQSAGVLAIETVY
jgi:cell division septation protein DedD